MPYTVTRQRPYYQPGINLVEISSGGIDYTGSDTLCAKYDGEFDTFASLSEAIETAIAIRRAWRKDGARHPQIGIGDTGGMGLEIEPSQMTMRALRALGKRIDNAAPKCPHCGDFMPDNARGFWRANDWDGIDYCSEDCASRAAEWEAEQTEEID